MNSYRLPDLHKSSNVLLVLIFGQILCSIVWLVESRTLSLSDYALYSFYALSVALLMCLILGMLRPTIAKVRLPIGVSFFLLAFSCCFMAVNIAAQFLMLGPYGFDGSDLTRNFLATTLLGALVARGMFLLQVLEDRNKAELQLKVDALQSRINPHFLFNSLNSIAELTATKPNAAEEAIQSLAMLFRISLESQKIQHSLEEEVTLCKRYISLESFRFDGGISLDFDLAVEKPAKWLVPKLILQPLLENAVKYGAVNDEQAPIRLRISESKKDISIRLVNKVLKHQPIRSGNGIAIQNIKDRLFVLYDDRFTYNQRNVDGSHYVYIQIPKIDLKSRRGKRISS